MVNQSINTYTCSQQISIAIGVIIIIILAIIVFLYGNKQKIFLNIKNRYKDGEK